MTADGFRRVVASALLCALAFNLTFFWQELWLVIPKALTPGLHPILFHNDHDWTGSAPSVDSSMTKASVTGVVKVNGSPATEGQVEFNPVNYARKDAAPFAMRGMIMREFPSAAQDSPVNCCMRSSPA